VARRDDIRTLLKRLDGEPADSLESETLDFKRWEDEARVRVRSLQEAVVCFANAQGGTVVVGVRDRMHSRKEAIEGVPPTDLNALRRSIYDGTDPHVLVEIELLKEPEGELLLIHVPRGIPPHTTSEGVAKIRVGKECRPLKGSQLPALMLSRASQDLTAQPLPDSSITDVDPVQVQTLRRELAAQEATSTLAKLGDRELLEGIGLVRESELTLAAVLLVGKPTAIARWAPQHEVVFLRFKSATRYDVRRDLKGPLFDVLDVLERLLEAHVKLQTIATESFGELSIPDITWYACREAVLNAMVHRDYFQQQAVQIELHPDRIQISSPGGFVGGVGPENVLRHPPVRRNPLLAETFQRIGLVNRAGLGVDRMCEELLRLGKTMPRYEADEAHVRLTLPIATHEAFARFVARETREGRVLSLDDLIALRGAMEVGMIDRWEGAKRLQAAEEHAAEVLMSLRGRGHLVPHGRGKGTSYSLPRELSVSLLGPEETDLGLDLDEHAVRLRVERILAERGKLTNAEVRRVSGYSRVRTVRLMKTLVEQGCAKLVGSGRGAHYVPTSGGSQPPKKGPRRG